ncbi:MAG TPA: hypothetical protein VIP30_04370 [Stenotrophomonas sp.]|jgi:hypothetical protein|nr:hypothetical protein [Stenotrophomonas sp.]
MDKQCYVVAVEQFEDAWLVSRPQWSPLRYLAQDGAIRNAEMMARLHAWTTGQPTEVVLRSQAGDHLVRRFG